MKTIFFIGYLFINSPFIFSQLGLICDFNGVDTIGVVIKNDTVNISNVKLCGYCSATYALSLTQSSDSIFIVETDTAGAMATCQCTFDINVAITGLTPGTYNVFVYREYLEKYAYQFDTTVFIGSVQFSISEPALNNLTFIPYQSECNTSGVDDIDNNIPKDFSLLQNYPNPFNPITVINYQLPRESNVVIKVFDCIGNEIISLVNEVKKPGNHKTEFDASSFSSGIYFYQLRTNDFISTKKMVLLR